MDFPFEDAKWLLAPGVVGGFFGLLVTFPWGGGYGLASVWWIALYVFAVGPLSAIFGIAAVVKAAEFYKLRPIRGWWWFRLVVALLGSVNPVLLAFWAWNIWRLSSS